MTAYARFQEPCDFDANCWRIFGTYHVESVVFCKARACDEIVCFDEINEQTYTIEYDIEQLKNSEPEIERVRVYSFDGRKLVQVEVDGSFEVACEDYLRDSHERWAKMREWLSEYGDRDYGREAA